MEVHHHAHTARKKWTHYIWEFLMLFLAVFCGFLAEYQLEHTIEKDREKQYIISLVKDLEYDTLQFNFKIDQLEHKIPYFDSVFSFLKNPVSFNYKLSLKYYLYSIVQEFYTPAEPTIQQLKNSGNLRLIKNKLVLDSILIYDNNIIGSYHDQIDYIFLFQNRLIAFTEKIFDFSEYNQYMDKYKFGGSFQNLENYDLPLLLKSSPELNELYNQFVDYKVADLYFKYLLENRKKEAVQLIKFIKKEYHLK